MQSDSSEQENFIVSDLINILTIFCSHEIPLEHYTTATVFILH